MTISILFNWTEEEKIDTVKGITRYNFYCSVTDRADSYRIHSHMDYYGSVEVTEDPWFVKCSYLGKGIDPMNEMDLIFKCHLKHAVSQLTLRVYGRRNRSIIYQY